MTNSIIIADKLSIKDSNGVVTELRRKREPISKTVTLPLGGWVVVDGRATFIYEDAALDADALVSLTPSLSLTNVYEAAQAVIVAQHVDGRLTFTALAGKPSADVSYELVVM